MWARASIASIIRALTAATVVFAILGGFFLALGLREIAAPFVLATAIAFGLTVVAVTWQLLTRAHPNRG